MSLRTIFPRAAVAAAAVVVLGAPVAAASQPATLVSYTGSGPTRLAATENAQANFEAAWPKEWAYCEIAAVNEASDWAGTRWWTNLNARCYH
ncbi:hypothetical protein ABT117_31230 [Streptomyces sp. NPDC002262]|uniref:hypothetical protein n=1 Tax=Streptomyces sp. NPDC002262 TaxID=3154414 RepID=UPI00331765BC